MHVLIIPSEEFLPKDNHLLGIFQKHQAQALSKAGCKVGILSIAQSLTILMLFKAICYKIIGKPVTNELKVQGIYNLFKLLYRKLFNLNHFISFDVIDNINIVRISAFYYLSNNKLTNFFGWIKAGELAWIKYCEKFGVPDVIHAHNAEYAGILTYKLCKKSEIRYVITEHSTFLARNMGNPLLKEKIKKCFTNASIFFVVSKSLGQLLDINYRSKFKWQVLDNVLDPEIENIEISKRELTGKFKFLTIGNLIRRKRQIDIIESFYKAFLNDASVELIVAGDGPDELFLKNQVNHLGLNNRIQFVGRIGRQDVIKYIDQSDCLILASEYETFGVVLIESLSRGKPIISSKCGGPESIVIPENGFLFETGNINELTVKMEMMKEYYNNFDKKKIRELAFLKYGSEVFGIKLKTAYQQILSKNE